MEATVVQGNVEVDNVAVFEDVLIGDSVADDLVDASADGLWKVAVV